MPEYKFEIDEETGEVVNQKTKTTNDDRESPDESTNEIIAICLDTAVLGFSLIQLYKLDVLVLDWSAFTGFSLDAIFFVGTSVLATLFLLMSLRSIFIAPSGTAD